MEGEVAAAQSQDGVPGEEVSEYISASAFALWIPGQKLQQRRYRDNHCARSPSPEKTHARDHKWRVTLKAAMPLPKHIAEENKA